MNGQPSHVHINILISYDRYERCCADIQQVALHGRKYQKKLLQQNQSSDVCF